MNKNKVKKSPTHGKVLTVKILNTTAVEQHAFFKKRIHFIRIVHDENGQKI